MFYDQPWPCKPTHFIIFDIRCIYPTEEIRPDGTFPPDNLIVVFNLSFKFCQQIHLLQVSYIASQSVSQSVCDEFRILNCIVQCSVVSYGGQWWWYLRTSGTVLCHWYWHPDTEDIVRLTSSWHNYIYIVLSLLPSMLSSRWVVAGHYSLLK